jgi:hypothetical protein
MSWPPATRPASTNTGVSPAPEGREIEIRYSGSQLVPTASREQALMQLFLSRALTLAESPDCDARVRYHLARAAELTAGEDGGAVETLPGGAN